MMEIVWQYGIKQAGITSGEYPVQLSSIAKAPPVLYYKGSIAIVSQNRNIAVVGSRHVSCNGRELAYRIGYALGKKNINVVNGLAFGCDAHALEGALAAGGKCVAVMPCGLDQVVPRSNAGLADKLLSGGGCLISEYPVQSPVQKYRYIERDRLQSGVSGGVLVIEAERGSGTMYTVNHARRQGRRIACIDSRLVKYSSGNKWLEGQNGVKVIRGIDDLEDFIRMTQDATICRQMTLWQAGFDGWEDSKIEL